jgi:hypothetical protein
MADFLGDKKVGRILATLSEAQLRRNGMKSGLAPEPESSRKVNRTNKKSPATSAGLSRQ